MNFKSYDLLPPSENQGLHLLEVIADAGFRKMDLDLMIETCLTGLTNLMNSQGAVLFVHETEEEWRFYPHFRTVFEKSSEEAFLKKCKEYLQKNRALPADTLFHQTSFSTPPPEPEAQTFNEWAVFPLEADDQFLGLLFLDLPESARLPDLLQPVLHQLCTGLVSVKNIRQLLMNDPMTGCYNRWFMDVELSRFCESLTRASAPFALMVMDIDHFKQINDRHGHACGDHVLISFVDLLSRRLPKNTSIIRIGGDEFLLWFPKIHTLTVQTLGDELLEDVENNLKIPNEPDWKITLSIGGVLHDPAKGKISKEELLERADHALYTSKYHGRNQLTLWDSGLEMKPWMWADPGAEISGDVQTLQKKISGLQTRIHRNQDRLVELLTNILSIKEFETGLHSHRVALITEYLLQHLNLSQEEKTAIHHGAKLHDIGKIAIPEHILHKQGPLNDEEWMVVKQHPRLGHRFIEHQGFHESACEIILHHHEHFDGSGYPRGLKGKNIPYGARLFCVVDAYDSMRANRIYRSYIPKNQAVEELQRKSGSQFDPDILMFFLKHLEGVERIGRWEA